MKYLISIIFIFSIQSSFSQSFKTSELNTKIDGVTVFLKGAQITRVGKADIKVGKSILKVKSLSSFIDEKSIQVKALGDFTILSVNHSFDYLNEKNIDERIEELKGKIAELEHKVKLNQNRLSILKEKSYLLDANKDLGGGQSGATMAQLKQALDFYEKELTLIKKEELILSQKNIDINKEKSKIQKQIADAMSNDDRPTGEIEIRIESSVATTGEFRISYLVANAGWYPKYDIRVKTIEQPISLSYNADVYQNTGVDWKDVKLKFSNADPSLSGVAPKLSTWYLNYARNTRFERRVMGYSDGAVGSVSGVVVDAEMGEPLPGASIVVKGSTVGTITDLEGRYQLTLPNGSEYVEFSFVGMVSQIRPVQSRLNVALESDAVQLSEVVITGYGSRALQGKVAGVSISKNNRQKKSKSIVTTAIENQTTVEFELETPYSIQSNGAKLTVALNQFDMEASYEYFAVPKLEKDAFLIARIVDWNQYNLLEGEANLFFEEAFVGRSILDANSLEDTLNISLGRDRGIVIARNKNQDFSRKRTVGVNKVDRRGFDILIRNNKSQPIKLTLFDQIPKASINDISVMASELSNGTLNVETGEVKWELDIAPKEQMEIELKYEVKYPKKEQIILE